MIVILTGSTGQIGGEVLKHCLSIPQVTRVFAITRRPLDLTKTDSNTMKLVNIVHSDFHNYPESVLSQLSGADTCIWSLGNPWAKNLREIDVEYTLAAASTFADKLQPLLKPPKKFKFVFVSGKFASVDQTKSLWFLQAPRRSKGEAEMALLKLEQDKPDQLDVSIVRPGAVLNTGGCLPDFILNNIVDGIRNDCLAHAILEIAENGFESKTAYNSDLVRVGKAAMSR